MRDPRPRSRLPFTLHFLQRGPLVIACLTTGLTAACTPPAASTGQTPPRPLSAAVTQAIPVIVRPARRFHTDQLATGSAPAPVFTAAAPPPPVGRQRCQTLGVACGGRSASRALPDGGGRG